MKKALRLLVILVFVGASYADRPNFILFIADDVSVNDIGCYGNPAVHTPTIDGLAQAGLRFDNAFLTISSCSPSRCSIITGRYPHNTGAPELHMPLPPDQLTFPMELKKAGYYTAQAGKWHMGGNPNVTEAFHDRMEGGVSGCENWVDTVQNRDKSKPFFFWFAAKDAHRGWDRNTLGKTWHEPEMVIVPPYLVDDRDTREDLAQYYNEISRFDWYIGQVIKELREQDALDNTMIIVIADNGRPFPRCKTRVVDSGMQTPMVVAWPQGLATKNADVPGLVSSIDIAPTILELAGIEAPESIQGVSFVPILNEPAARIRRYVFSEHNWHDYEAHERQVRTEKYMYIRNARPHFANQGPADSVRSPSHRSLLRRQEVGTLTPAQRDVLMTPRPAEELFDVVRDPHQLLNVADDPKYAPVLTELRLVMDAWQEQTDDTVPYDLTPDKFDRTTGKNIFGQKGIVPQSRGTTVGSERQATTINETGPI